MMNGQATAVVIAQVATRLSQVTVQAQVPTANAKLPRANLRVAQILSAIEHGSILPKEGLIQCN